MTATPTSTPTPAPAIGVAKRVVDVSFDPVAAEANVTYEIEVRNTGNVTLGDLTLSDDIVADFGAPPLLGVTDGPTIVASTATQNPGLGVFPSDIFDGTSGVLEPGQFIRVQFTVRLRVVGPSIFINQASASGTTDDEETVSDVSDSGADSDGNNPGEPGDTGGSDDPTPLFLGAAPAPTFSLAGYAAALLSMIGIALYAMRRRRQG